MIKNKFLLCALFALTPAFIVSNTCAEQTLHNDTTQITNQQSLHFSEVEFDQLLIDSLANDANGQLLLAVSDSLSTIILDSHIEISAVIDLDKVEKVSPQARQSFERFDHFFFFLDKNKLNITVLAEPVTRNGLIGIRDNFSIKLGSIPISNNALRQLSVQVEQASLSNLQLADLNLQSVSWIKGKITLNSKGK